MSDHDTSGLLREIARMHLQLQRVSVACCGGTTTTQCFILSELGRNGPMTLAELGRRLDLEKSWLSRAVKSLVQKKLLVKKPSETDRRAIMISLSAAGERRYRELNDTLNEQAGRVMGRISRAERPGVVKAMQLLREALETEAASESVKQAGEMGRVQRATILARKSG